MFPNGETAEQWHVLSIIETENAIRLLTIPIPTQNLPMCHYISTVVRTLLRAGIGTTDRGGGGLLTMLFWTDMWRCDVPQTTPLAARHNRKDHDPRKKRVTSSFGSAALEIVSNRMEKYRANFERQFAGKLPVAILIEFDAIF